MPEGYTHVRTGTNALHKSNIKKTANLLAFGAGTNGPDPLFFREVWKKSAKRHPDLPFFGGRMHKEKTGAFLFSLIKNAVKPSQKAYALGFLTHYATDLTMHPYVEYITTANGAPYAIIQGHGFFEIALDSHLHKKDFGDALIPQDHSTPTPSIEELKEIAELFSRACIEVYAMDIAEADIVKAFKNMYTVRSLLKSRTGIKKAVFSFVEKAIMKDKGLILSHVTPAAPLKLPDTAWVNPYTLQSSNKDCFELLNDAENLGAVFINAACDYWDKRIDAEKLLKIIGSKSYESGLEDDISKNGINQIKKD